MQTPSQSLFFVPFLVLLSFGCSVVQPKLKTVKSPGVERIPLKLAVLPLLSSPIPGAESLYYGGALYGAPSPTSMQNSNVGLVIQTANSNFSITQESQIMSDLVSAALAVRGFSLKQVPLETLDAKDEAGKSSSAKKDFAVSLALLRELQGSYGVEGIVMGNVFFTYERNEANIPEKKVYSVSIKVIDIKTLDVLGQVVLPYRPMGFGLEATSEKIADAFFDLANPKAAGSGDLGKK
jgi:hypothetical protein